MEAAEKIIERKDNKQEQKKLYIESYGCAMNISDSEIVGSIMQKHGFKIINNYQDADAIFINTCSIRAKAEQTIRTRLGQFNKEKKNNPSLIIGILGCMAERLKNKLLDEEKIIDIVAGPDSYRDLPRLLQKVEDGHKAVNTILSKEETYADISPIRLNSNGVTAFISIMRGCNNMCTFCIVPFTRGRERSRDPYSIVKEAQELFDNGYREVTLLGQNVDSYRWSPNSKTQDRLRQIEDDPEAIDFAKLLEMVAKVNINLRIRFSTSHPKDITDDVLYTIKKYENICNYIHLPVQSGNSRILEVMNRTYTREWYLKKIDKIREVLGYECGISSDMIAGFCSELEEEHKDTLTLMDYVKYDFSYMFYYSERPGTLASRKFEDDIPLEVKKRRLAEIIDRQSKHSLERNKLDIGKTFRVLIEGFSKRSNDFLSGRNPANKVVIFPKKHFKKGQYVDIKINDCTKASLFGEVNND
ncbi:MAG: tRNA (N6-isopentenyl adenosine(37)-C2)-methylthiotransferase MiaB [Bacteroidetes bacterium]|nr:tRNA (N6-isopentenyl adenosine(37)-C2)-methylthiotransferase MiaB [Bacteroidota bacterium]